MTGPQERRAIAREVAQFNDLIPVGTPVLYWPALREGEGTPSRTRTRAWLLGDHTPVVMVDGYAGGIALSHVCPLPSDGDVERCICPPGFCLGAEDQDGPGTVECRPCLALDPELPCLAERGRS